MPIALGAGGCHTTATAAAARGLRDTFFLFAFGNSRRWLIHRPEPHGDELQQLLQFFPWECVGSGFDFGQCAHGKRLSATHNPGKTTFPAEMAARQNTWRNKSSAPHAMNFIRLAANTTIFSNSQPWLQRWMLVSP